MSTSSIPEERRSPLNGRYDSPEDARGLPRMLRNVVLPRKGLRADEESDGGQYVQRPSLGWLVGQCCEAQLTPVCVCSHRQAASGRFPARTALVGGRFSIVATA
ncbi:MAG: hypothetical protein QOI71_974 [Gaiellales bacterium]|nr:hypothetical protein [Gaiellales bacterium]